MEDKILKILGKLYGKFEKLDSKVSKIESTMVRTEARIATIESTMTTKNDLHDLKKELTEYTDGWFNDLLMAVDKSKAEKNDVEILKGRVRNIERKLLLS